MHQPKATAQIMLFCRPRRCLWRIYRIFDVTSRCRYLCHTSYLLLNCAIFWLLRPWPYGSTRKSKHVLLMHVAATTRLWNFLSLAGGQSTCFIFMFTSTPHQKQLLISPSLDRRYCSIILHFPLPIYLHPLTISVRISSEKRALQHHLYRST